MLQRIWNRMKSAVGSRQASREDALSAEDRALAERAAGYQWYHRVALNERVATQPDMPELAPIWEFIRGAVAEVPLEGRRVLDVGCRDGLFSLEAERAGAAEVLAVDSDLSGGLRDLLIPHFQSRIQLERLNLYDLDPARHGGRDVIFFFGVLYHLRYPFWGLKKIIDCLRPDGVLLLETAILEDTPATEQLELLYCPVARSPYEPTSCTFYNRLGLETTLESLGMRVDGRRVLEGTNLSETPGGSHKISRQLYTLRRAGVAPEKAGLNVYWDEVHTYHTEQASTRPGRAEPRPPDAAPSTPA